MVVITIQDFLVLIQFFFLRSDLPISQNLQYYAFQNTDLTSYLVTMVDFMIPDLTYILNLFNVY